MTLGEIAARLACQVVGDPDTQITGLATIAEATHTQLTFLANPKYRRALAQTKAAAAIVSDTALLPPGCAGLIAPDPYLAFAEALSLFFTPPAPPAGIHPQAIVSPSARLGADVSIGPCSVIGDEALIGDQVTILSHCIIYPAAIIGARSFIHSHCVVREGCQLGQRVILQNHVVIGSDGFGYAKRPDRAWQTIPQTGIVIVQDDVHIGAGTTIARATLGATRIARGTKIDNLTHIGHGSSVGEDCLLCAQVGLAGSTHLGREVILGGQVGAAGHLHIGDGATATPQTGIAHSVPPRTPVAGSPAIAHRDWLKASAAFAQLPQMQRDLRQLRARLKALEQQLSNSTHNR
jgi:UDP-3-O-[3-hydroxymyristoyl] glucosamine N-acyltransferase